jgi:hypothetical protein
MFCGSEFFPSLISDPNQQPFVAQRGVNFNVPLDICTTSFDGSGGLAQNNGQTIWDFAVRRGYFEDLARCRENVISLWAAHPFPAMIKREELTLARVRARACLSVHSKQKN